MVLIYWEDGSHSVSFGFVLNGLVISEPQCLFDLSEKLIAPLGGGFFNRVILPGGDGGITGLVVTRSPLTK